MNGDSLERMTYIRSIKRIIPPVIFTPRRTTAELGGQNIWHESTPQVTNSMENVKVNVLQTQTSEFLGTDRTLALNSSRNNENCCVPLLLPTSIRLSAQSTGFNYCENTPEEASDEAYRHSLPYIPVESTITFIERKLDDEGKNTSSAVTVPSTIKEQTSDNADGDSSEEKELQEIFATC